MDHNTIRRRETIDTIRARVIERSYWRQGQRIGARTEGSENVGITRSVWKHAKTCGESGIGLLKYFCPDYVSKNGVSVTEGNIVTYESL